MSKILVIDDDEMMCATLSALIQRKGHTATCATTLQQGKSLIESQDFDIAFLDVKMPDGSGLDLLAQIEATPTAPEVIIITGFGDPDGAELAIKSGAWDYIEKGFSIKEITLSLERALQYRKEKQEALHGRKTIPLKRANIIGNSPALNTCLELVAQSAGSDAHVFISGETGTGKELFARAVHENSNRRSENFVVVDCTALPETLVESLLFGHEKGAFTGAERTRDGLVKQAHKGTLFLDEVGELPMSLQKSFLRVLQEHRFRPLGAIREIESDFRLIAATNRDLDAMAEEGSFRSDLLFRLRSFLIELPPLRKRKEDIKAMTRHYIDRFCEQHNSGPKGLDAEFLHMLMLYPWPGNVRELVNTLERTLTAAQFDPTLFPQHLPNYIRVHVRRAAMAKNTATPERLAPMATSDNLPKLQDYREEVLNRAEQQYLTTLMSQAHTDISLACDISGLSQSRLYALLKKYDISRKS